MCRCRYPRLVGEYGFNGPWRGIGKFEWRVPNVAAIAALVPSKAREF